MRERARAWTSHALMAAGWAVVGVTGAVAVTQLLRIGQPYPLPVIHSFSPYAILPVFGIALVANVVRRYALAIGSGVVGLAYLALVGPAVIVVAPPVPPADAPRVTVLSANVLMDNPTPAAAAAAIADTDADVIALTEFRGPVRDALGAAEVEQTYPYRELAEGTSTEGLAVYSRHPILRVSEPVIGAREVLDVTISVDGAPLRILVVHPLPPVWAPARDDWASDLAAIGVAGRAGDDPVVIVGDFNAARWHPDFRRLLRRGYRDAHEWLGAGLTPSWPANGRTPAFIRLDHALLRGDVVPVSVSDVDIAGSDHRGFVLELALTGASAVAAGESAAPWDGPASS